MTHDFFSFLFFIKASPQPQQTPPQQQQQPQQQSPARMVYFFYNWQRNQKTFLFKNFFFFFKKSPQQAGTSPGERPLRSETSQRLKATLPAKPPGNPELENKMASQKIMATSNYFPVGTKQPHIFQYAVAFDPPLDSRTMRYSMLASHTGLLGNLFFFSCIIFPPFYSYFFLHFSR